MRCVSVLAPNWIVVDPNCNYLIGGVTAHA